jgi:hypothetical protein
VPVLFATRRANNSYYTQHADGIGDTDLTAQTWLWDPLGQPAHNVQLGFGFQAPTGQDNVRNNVIKAPGQAPTVQPADYSIQPGTGGWGIVFGWNAFQDVGSRGQVYFNGSYLATPQNTTGVLRNPTAKTQDPLSEYASISDEYLLQAGVAYVVESVKGLALTFGPRDEGVPVRDLIGQSLGFRRPGFAISLEPGVDYVRGAQMFTASIGRALYRDRSRSVPDLMENKHGDAAFADWVWFAGYVHRF